MNESQVNLFSSLLYSVYLRCLPYPIYKIQLQFGDPSSPRDDALDDRINKPQTVDLIRFDLETKSDRCLEL